jgi:hypothetical protein
MLCGYNNAVELFNHRFVPRRAWNSHFNHAERPAAFEQVLYALGCRKNCAIFQRSARRSLNLPICVRDMAIAIQK